MTGASRYLEAIRARAHRRKHRAGERTCRARAASSCTSPRCPGGRLGPRGLPVRRLAGRGGQSWWQVLPLGPPDRYHSPYKSRSAFAAWPGLLADRRAPVSRRRDARLPRAPALLDRRLGALRRRAARSPTRSASSASGRRCERYARRARGAADRRRARSTSRPAAPTTWPIPSCSSDGCVAGAPPDAYSRHGPAVGQPAVRLAGAAAAPATAGGSSGCGARSSSSTSPGSTTSAASSPTGRCPRARARAVGGTLAARARARRCSTRLRAASLGRAAAAGRRGPRRDHRRRSSGCATARAARDARGPVRLRPRRPRTARTGLENHIANRVVYTGTHDQDTARGWLESLTRAQRAFVDAELAPARVRRAREPWWGLIRLAFSSPARMAMIQAQDVLGLGSEARMNVPGDGRRELALADAPAR